MKGNRRKKVILESVLMLSNFNQNRNV